MFFSKKKEQKIIPKVGEEWTLTDNSPWPDSNIVPVTILDVKEDWVRYYLSPMFPDNRMELDIFLSIYSKLEEN